MEDINNFKQRKKNSSNKGLICCEDGCNLNAKTRGYCKKHYTKHYRAGDFNESIIQKRESKECIVPGCTEIGEVLGYCKKHYQRLQKYGDSTLTNNELHGQSKTPEYSVWSGMRNRCLNPHSPSYKNYGGRGIKICDRWLESFIYFLEDMGKRPSLKHQIDRIDNNGDYEPSNCRWVLPVVNVRNKGSLKMNPEKVRSLRKDRESGLSIRKTAKKCNISITNVKDIMNKKIWGDV